MSKLLMHPLTESKVNSIINNPPHALLITGKPGSGKYSLGLYISSMILNIDQDKIKNSPYFMSIEDNKGVISIDSIRSIHQFIKLKVPSSKDGIHRIVYIANAHNMRIEAQNSLLKTLEEPPIGTMIILTSDDKELLLTTIQSRTIELNVLPISINQAKKFFSDKKDLSTDKLTKIHALSQGQPGLLSSLAEDQSHKILEDIELAKQILSKDKATRLILIDELSKDKHKITNLLDALLRITHAALLTSSKKNDIDSTRKWQKTQESVLKSIEKFNANCQSKLILDDLFLNI